MTGKSGRGTARQTIRVDEALWERFAHVAEPDRSSMVRELIAWCVEDPDEVKRLLAERRQVHRDGTGET